jgi:hypothetical protein
LFVCCELVLTSANISSLPTGFVLFLIGRFDRKSLSSSSSNGKTVDFAAADG